MQPIAADVVHECSAAVRVEVIGQDSDPALRRKHSKWSDAREEVPDDFIRLKASRNPFVLGLQAAAPVHFAVVKGKDGGAMLMIQKDAICVKS